jgi:hypothetical protein
MRPAQRAEEEPASLTLIRDDPSCRLLLPQHEYQRW